MPWGGGVRNCASEFLLCIKHLLNHFIRLFLCLSNDYLSLFQWLETRLVIERDNRTNTGEHTCTVALGPNAFSVGFLSRFCLIQELYRIFCIRLQAKKRTLEELFVRNSKEETQPLSQMETHTAQKSIPENSVEASI